MTGSNKRTPKKRVLVISGLSGAGKTLALKTLEDLGFEAIDNIPLRLVGEVVSLDTSTPNGAPDTLAETGLALGVDTRSRAFSATHLIDLINGMRADPRIECSLLYLDCNDMVLQRRFTETRRKHPMALHRPVQYGIDRERKILQPVREASDLMIDTSELSIPDLRRLLEKHYRRPEDDQIAITILSFSYRKGLPQEADLVFDVRFLANPHYDPKLQKMTGKDAKVAQFIRKDPEFQPFLDRLQDMLLSLLPNYQKEGKSYLSIAFGCTGGRHRSIFMAEEVSTFLRDNDFHVTTVHRDTDLQGLSEIEQNSSTQAG